MRRMMQLSFLKYMSWYLVMAMFIIGVAPRVYAGFSPSEVMDLSPINRASDLQKVQEVLEMRMISERLQQLGLTPDQIQARLTQLSDDQIHQFALQLDDLKVGGDSALGILIGLLAIAILAVILIYLLGHRIIVT